MIRNVVGPVVRPVVSLIGDVRKYIPQVPVDPLLVSAIASVINETSANASVQANKNNGVLYWIASNSATQPTQAQIKVGQTNAGVPADAFGAQAISEVGVQSVFGGVVGLTQGATYYMHFYFETDALEPSNILTSASFVPADVTAPVLSSIEATQTGATTASVTVNTDTGAGTLYWIAVASGAPASTSAQVQAGSSQAVTASGPQSFGVTGLIAETGYLVRAVHRDVAGNVSAIVESPTFTTASATVYARYFHDGSTASVPLFNSLLTGNQSDQLGGTNAILFSGDGLGPGTNETVAIEPPVTFNAGPNVVRMRLKVISSVATNVWLRTLTKNVTSSDLCHINITNDATLDSARVGNKSGTVVSASVTNLGSGWMSVEIHYDFSGDADVVGVFGMFIGTADNSVGVINNVANSNQIAIYDMSFATA